MNVDPKIVRAILTGSEQTDSPAPTVEFETTPEQMALMFIQELGRIPSVPSDFVAEFSLHFIPLIELLNKHEYPAFFSVQLKNGFSERDLSFSLRPQEAIFHLAHMSLYGDGRRAELRQAFRRLVTGAAVKWLKDHGISSERLMGLPELPTDLATFRDLQVRAYAYLLAPFAFDEIEGNLLTSMIRQRIGQLVTERGITELAEMGDSEDGAE